jgi:hypothetical protein
VVVLIVGGLYVAAQRFGAGAETHQSLIPGEVKPWKVEVVNVAGEDGLALRMTSYLRTLGYDVVAYHSRPLKGVERTMLIDRRGTIAAAEDLARTLGFPADRVVTALDRTLYVDVTVAVGFDYRQFPSLKHLENAKDTP